MSYTRFSEDSDTYTLSGMAGFICVSCRLTTPSENRTHDNQTFVTMKELVEHLLLHMKYGHKVPRGDLKRLYREMKKRKEEENDS
jgi:hypothetical protein